MTAATAVREKPILFSGAMVRAILDGRKTQTRRIVKSLPVDCVGVDATDTPGVFYVDCERSECGDIMCPYGKPGDRLWVRETWKQGELGPYYRADGHIDVKGWPWKPAIHMPRCASRITLEITGVRVERVQDISEEDAQAEGVRLLVNAHGAPLLPISQTVEAHPLWRNPAKATLADYWTGYFALLWQSINGKRPGCAWADNPWVWCLEFRRVQ